MNLLKFGRDMDGPEAVENIKSRMGEDFPRLQDVLGLTQSRCSPCVSPCTRV